MNRFPTITATALLLLPAAAGAGQKADRFLSGPAEGTPLEVSLAYLEDHHAGLGLAAGDLADLAVQSQYDSRHTGVTHISLRQRLSGVEVVNGDIGVHVMPDGRIVHLTSRFVPDLAARVNARAPAVEPEIAILRAAEHLGLTPGGPPSLLEVEGGPAMAAVYDGTGISLDPIPAQLMYLPRGEGGVRLVWSLVIRQLGTSDWWNLFVDALTGEVLEKFNWTVSERPAVALGRPGPAPAGARESRAPTASGAQATEDAEGCAANCYRVFALPKESPSDGDRTLDADPADATASPFGWHDTDGAAGAEFTDSRGNNVEAQTDLDANNVFTAGTDVRSQGGANLIFDDPLDLGQEPPTYLEAAVTNLFYYNNIMHDVTYQYGFDEPSGNFQQNNYGNGGAAGDPVQADAQDGSGTNNANFSTPPDGGDGRMQMFVWTPFPNGRVTENSPTARDFVAGRGTWGGDLDPPTTGDLELVEDGTGNNEGCNALIGFTPGNVALIDRGTCEFGTKALNAENAGASGVIIVNNQQLPNGIIPMGAGANGGSVTIPTVMIGNADGQLLKDELALPATVNVTLQLPLGGLPPDRDSDLDNGVIGHEYGHGISNRLVGGPANVNCLNGAEQMGEGWSDWWTLVLSAIPADTAELPRGIATYLTFEPPTGLGIRNFPYSTDLNVNPQTYGDVGDTNIPHGVGEIWNALLWEMYWLLVPRDGFSTDFYTGSGGNNLAIQLVVDGMKMTACSPGFVDGRDGILAADVALTGGANECQIWTGFAKRGVGFSASQGSSGVVGDEIEAFDFPPGLDPDCVNQIFTDGFESGDTSAWSGSVP